MKDQKNNNQNGENRFLNLRKSKGVSQTDLADELGVNRTTIYKIEKSEMNPGAELLKSYSKYFGVCVDYLLGLYTYEKIILERAYYSGRTLEEEKQSIIDEEVKKSEQEELLIDELMESQKEFRNISQEELDDLADLLNIDKHSYLKINNKSEVSEAMIRYLKKIYKGNESVFLEEKITIQFEDYKLIKSVIELIFNPRGIYYKGVVQEILDNVHEYNAILKLLFSLEAGSRKHLQHFLEEIKKHRG